MQAQASFSASLEKIINDLSNRRVNPQQSFGSYASEEEIQRVMALAYAKITELQTKAGSINAPEDTRSNLSAAMQQLISDNQKKITELKDGTGGSTATIANFNSAIPSYLPPDSQQVKDEIARLQAEIDNALRGQ